MKTFFGFVLAALFGYLSVGAQAATEQLVATGYNVVTKLPEKITLPNGSVIMVGAQGHASIVNDKTAEQTSQWCNIDTWVDAKGAHRRHEKRHHDQKHQQRVEQGAKHEKEYRHQQKERTGR